MIDLSKVGFQIVERPGQPIIVLGGIILTAKVEISKLAPDMEGARQTAMFRAKQRIWQDCYGHLDDPLNVLKQFLSDPEMAYPGLKQFDNAQFMSKLRTLVGKLEDAITEAEGRERKEPNA